jgi:hypothetical protein
VASVAKRRDVTQEVFLRAQATSVSRDAPAFPATATSAAHRESVVRPPRAASAVSAGRYRGVPTRVGTLKGAGWGRESHRRDGELGRRLVRGRRGGSIFRPLSTPGEGVDPSIQAIGAGVKDPLFWGRRFVLVQPRRRAPGLGAAFLDAVGAARYACTREPPSGGSSR